MNDSDDTAEINIFVNEPLKDGKGKILYDCGVMFRGKEYYITQEIDGLVAEMVPSLEFIADEIKDLLVEETQDWKPSHRDSLDIKYFSDPLRKDPSGHRGYACGEDSFLVRALEDSEMRTFMREVDSRVRPLFYEDEE